MSLITLLEYASVLVFAITGALVASRAQLDLVGFAFIACLTALGGGTLRDLLLDRNPIFWIANPTHLAVGVTAAMVVFFTAHLLESRYRGIVWLDALALAVAVPSGVGVALAMGMSWPVIIIMGITTGCFGGLMRDVVCNEVPLVLKQGELYITCAMAGSLSAVVMIEIGLSLPVALLICATVCWSLRAGAINYGWHLPVYKSRPPRH